MRSNKRRRRKPTGPSRAEREQRRAEYLARLTPEQLAAYEAERDYKAYRVENRQIREPRQPRSPSQVR